MKKFIKNKIKSFSAFIIKKMVVSAYGVNSNIYRLLFKEVHLKITEIGNSHLGENVKLYPPYKIHNSQVGDYTYIAENSIINNSSIGKFCSIGPNLIAGWGIHPMNGLSTHPMFYSAKKQNGMTLSTIDKIEETKNITIGNDVFIGMNVTILDGVKIGDGAVIGAGAVVSKDIPSYAIAVGNPVKIIKYRFDIENIDKLLQIKWWDFANEDLIMVEKNFFEVEEFIKNIEKKYNSPKNI